MENEKDPGLLLPSLEYGLYVGLAISLGGALLLSFSVIAVLSYFLFNFLASLIAAAILKRDLSYE